MVIRSAQCFFALSLFCFSIVALSKCTASHPQCADDVTSLLQQSAHTRSRDPESTDATDEKTGVSTVDAKPHNHTAAFTTPHKESKSLLNSTTSTSKEAKLNRSLLNSTTKAKADLTLKESGKTTTSNKTSVIEADNRKNVTKNIKADSKGSRITGEKFDVKAEEKGKSAADDKRANLSETSSVDLETVKYFWLGKNGNLARAGASSYAVTRDFTGGPTWNITLKPGDVRSTPLIDDLRNIYLASTDGHVYKYDHEGHPLWNISVGSNIFATPIITHGSVFVSTSASEALAISMEHGNITWRRKLSKSCNDATAFSVTAGSGIVIVAARGGADCGNRSYIQAVDAAKGNMIWTFLPSHRINDHGFLSGMFAIKGSELIFATVNGDAYKLDIHTGQQLWAHESTLAENATVIAGNCSLDYEPVAPPSSLDSSDDEDEASKGDSKDDVDVEAEGSGKEPQTELTKEIKSSKEPQTKAVKEVKSGNKTKKSPEAEEQSLEATSEDELDDKKETPEAGEATDSKVQVPEADADKGLELGDDDFELEEKGDHVEESQEDLDFKTIGDLQEHTGVIWSNDHQVILVTSNPVHEKTGKRVGRVEALSIDTGRLLWQVNLDTMISNGPVIGQLHPSGKGEPSVLVVVSSSGQAPYKGRKYTGKLIAFGAHDGALRNWAFQQPAWKDEGSCPLNSGLKQAFSNPAIGGDGTVYVGSGNGLLYAIQDRDGDGYVDATSSSNDVTTFETGNAFIASPSIAPGMLAAAPCNGLVVFKSF